MEWFMRGRLFCTLLDCTLTTFTNKKSDRRGLISKGEVDKSGGGRKCIVVDVIYRSADSGN